MQDDTGTPYVASSLQLHGVTSSRALLEDNERLDVGRYNWDGVVAEGPSVSVSMGIVVALTSLARSCDRSTQRFGADVVVVMRECSFLSWASRFFCHYSAFRCGCCLSRSSFGHTGFCV